MELPNQEDHEMPIPLNSTYGHGHMIHHHDHHPIPTISHMQQIPPSNGPIMPDDHAAAAAAAAAPFKKIVRYKECLKNHAASMGGNATDGCGEFMPSGEEGTLEALVCSACSCHRNFHRKETEGDDNGHNNNSIQHNFSNCDNSYYLNSRMGRKLLLGHNHAMGYHSGTLISSRNAAPHHPMIMPYNMGAAAPSESDEQEGGGGGAVAARPVHQIVKKRFRTKFTQEQKDKMHSFAEKVGWKIQKQEESLVQQFCQELGVKRRVLKVWMHNNKHNLAKKNHQSNAENQVLETDN